MAKLSNKKVSLQRDLKNFENFREARTIKISSLNSWLDRKKQKTKCGSLQKRFSQRKYISTCTAMSEGVIPSSVPVSHDHLRVIVRHLSASTCILTGLRKSRLPLLWQLFCLVWRLMSMCLSSSHPRRIKGQFHYFSQPRGVQGFPKMYPELSQLSY